MYAFVLLQSAGRARNEMSLNVRTLRRPAGTSSGRRFRANWPAELRGGGVRVPCTVVDVSSSGACLRIEQQALPKRTEFWLIVEKVPPIPVVAAWRKANHLGLRFRTEQQWVLDSYEQRFDPAAWLKN